MHAYLPLQILYACLFSYQRPESAGKTGKVSWMKEPYGEGVANHTGPESCGGGSNAVAEALTGVHAGRVLSREIG
jgi:hypothetical protein